MVLALVLAARMLVTDSTYATPALRRLVADAAAAAIPRDLGGYQATLETDVAVLQPDVQGREHATQLEQVESRLTWRQDGALEQHVVGYRSRGGATLSALTLLRRPWVLPTLYGNRLRLLLGSSLLEGAKDGPGGVLGVHPLAQDRDAVYQFTGGDTVATIGLRGRRVTLVRVHVIPRADLRTTLLVFRGDLDIDAERKQIVHMRGELGAVTHWSPIARARRTALRRYVFVEVLDAELAGRFWLPTYERIDVQARSSLSDGFRPGFRVVTRFRDHALDTLTAASGTSDPTVVEPGRLTFAPRDSLDAFGAWHDEIGVNATTVGAADFDDLSDDAARPNGARHVAWRSEQLSDVLRFDKIEGLYTGVSGYVPLRPADSTGALSLAGRGGWAWAEATARGSASIRWRRDRWRGEVTAQRDIANTSDFVPSLEGPATVSALLASIDDYDYVGRTSGTVALSRAFDDRASRVLRVELGPGRDAVVRNNTRRGLFLFDSTFRPNRPVVAGGYLREAVALSVNPGVSGDLLEPGIGYGLSYERGDLGLRWQRVDALLATRHTVGPITYFGRTMAAAVFGGAPYQQLVEFGENEGMPGYGYKEFGGDRAALGRVGVSYTLPVFGAPIRVRRWLTLPGPSPAFTVSVQGGWADAAAEETRRALASIGEKPGPDGLPVPRTGPTGGVRSSIAVAFDLFGGAIGLGVAHPFDRGGWTFILGSQAW